MIAPIESAIPETESDDITMLALVEKLALCAGRIVMDVFRSDFDVMCKDDATPVTQADQAAERMILEGLRSVFPDIPCVAEEESSQGLGTKNHGRRFFLIDPLDGTREFVARRDEFTVNIALIRDGAPVIGVVYAPASRRCFAGRPGRAEEITVSSSHMEIARRRIHAGGLHSPLKIVSSRSHGNTETEQYIHDLGQSERISIGSSLKFCMLAAGEADLYPRFSRTMEWDTAAGDAVLRAAGGMTLTLDGKPLAYGKCGQVHEADYANPAFIARGDWSGMEGPVPK